MPASFGAYPDAGVLQTLERVRPALCLDVASLAFPKGRGHRETPSTWHRPASLLIRGLSLHLRNLVFPVTTSRWHVTPGALNIAPERDRVPNQAGPSTQVLLNIWRRLQQRRLQSP